MFQFPDAKKALQKKSNIIIYAHANLYKRVQIDSYKIEGNTDKQGDVKIFRHKNDAIAFKFIDSSTPIHMLLARYDPR